TYWRDFSLTSHHPLPDLVDQRPSTDESKANGRVTRRFFPIDRAIDSEADTWIDQLLMITELQARLRDESGGKQRIALGHENRDGIASGRTLGAHVGSGAHSASSTPTWEVSSSDSSEPATAIASTCS